MLGDLGGGMILIAGAVPIRNLPLTWGEARIEGESLALDDHNIPCTQGTGAMICAALTVIKYLKLDPPQVLVSGDIGEGKGSRSIYEYLIQELPQLSPQVLVLHYCLPNMGLMRKLCESTGRCHKKPIMIADAGSMYAAKAAGLAPKFDIFTPDSCEMAFLADPEATHPAYINRHLFDTDISQTPKLAATAYQLKNAAKLLLVKGPIDWVVEDGEILATVTEPNLPELEAIGGTGDTITGLVSAFAYAGLELPEAAIIAAKSNRMAGKFAQATPATKVWQIINQFPAVFKEYLCEWSGVCYVKGGGGND
jgi:NAD(P)H-hydrate repair Nnr-like enzyme with NAD(P)H-hydrate dehydratase domain